MYLTIVISAKFIVCINGKRFPLFERLLIRTRIYQLRIPTICIYLILIMISLRSNLDDTHIIYRKETTEQRKLITALSSYNTCTPRTAENTIQISIFLKRKTGLYALQVRARDYEKSSWYNRFGSIYIMLRGVDFFYSFCKFLR